MTPLRRLLVLALVPALGTAGALHWAQLVQLDDTRAQLAAASARLAKLEVVAVQVRRFEQMRETLARNAEIVSRLREEPQPIHPEGLYHLLVEPRAGWTIERFWIRDGLLELTGVAGSRAEANRIAQRLEALEIAEESELRHYEPLGGAAGPGRFAIFARVFRTGGSAR